MTELIVKKKTGFFSPEPVKIYDKRPDRYEIFFQSDDSDCYFNLPAGTYYTNSLLYKTKTPRKYNLPPLPLPDFGYFLPTNLKVQKVKNVNKCSINLENKSIELDPHLSSLPLPNIVHILFHEIGHYYYNNVKDPNMEHKCDIFASYHMIKKGYNPSQCYTATIENLNGPTSKERNLKHYNYLRNSIPGW